MAEYRDELQNESEAKLHLDHQGVMESERAPWESLWRDVDERVDPEAQGGFYKTTPSGERGLDNFDATAIEGLDRYTAGIAGLSIPRNARWHGLATPNKDLNRIAAVRRWNEHATDRLFACRYAPSAGFEMQATSDIRQGGKYGTAPLWVDEMVGRGLFYKAVHLSEVYIDEDFRGRVDTTHRKFELSVRQARQQFGEDALSDRMMQCWTNDNPAKRDEKFEFLHVICPRADYEPGNPGPNGKPIKSLYLGIDEKFILRRGGYRTMPMPVSRNVTSPGSKYGRSPAMKVIGHIRTVNAMAKTMLRAMHKQVDPALAFYDDGDISKLVTKPGGLNPGLVDEMGRLLVQPIPHGGDISGGMAFQEAERQPIKDAFLEHLFQILTDPSDRMTATQVLEMIQKQGVLVGPFAGRHETEKLGPMIERELDILMNAGQIDPMPPEMIEARMRPIVIYENPLARMSRAEEAAGFTRWVEILVQLASFDPGVLDYVNFDRAVPGVADVLSVRPSWANSPDEVAAKRQKREEAEQVAQLSGALPDAAGAALDLARANQISNAA